MKLAALLALIGRQRPPLPPTHVDPLQAIYQRCNGMSRECSERQTLERLALAITQGTNSEFDEREVLMLNLPAEALGLLDALVERAIGGS